MTFDTFPQAWICKGRRACGGLRKLRCERSL